MRLNLLIANFAYVGKQRVCLFDGPGAPDDGDGRGVVGRDPAACRMVIEGDNSVSRQHVEILFSGGRFWVRNLSRYGTRITNKQDLLEVGAKLVLENNDRIQIGETEILATILPSSAARNAPVGLATPPKRMPLPAKTAESATPDMVPAPPSIASGPPRTAQLQSVGDDPLAAIEGDDSSQAVRLPPAPKKALSKHQIPDDLDLELLLGMGSASSPAPAEPAHGTARKRHTARMPALNLPDAEPGHRSPGNQADTSSGDSIAVILSAAGIDAERVATLRSKVTPEMLGELLGTLVSAISGQLMVRDSFKRAFRLATTEIKSTGNNPLKLPASPADVVADLIDPPTGFFAAADAVRDAALELQVHQAAVAECIRTSFESLVDFLDPSKIEGESDKGGRSLLGHLSGGRDANSWKLYRELYEKSFGDRHRAFLTIYLERFGQDYESATNRVKSGSNKKSPDRRKGK